MGVVVQEMVPADSAGVMFTRDAVTHSPQFMTISGNFGLGEVFISYFLFSNINYNKIFLALSLSCPVHLIQMLFA